VLFPRLLDNLADPPAELTRVLLEHVHGLVAQLRADLADGAPNAEQLRRLGETLQSHVRFEEKELFPLIETVVPQESLEAMIFQDRDRSAYGRDP
jgi:hemerythrin-like domain-containing protein